MKAIALLSGGLDSELSAKLILNQGIDVYGAYFSHVFGVPINKTVTTSVQKVSTELGIPLKVFHINKEMLSIVKGPKHGYGSNMNPCIDCKILIFKMAKSYMEEIDAKFIITGEVLGQRPMSQNKQSIELIERESGLQGFIVRPLSAQVLSPSIPEQNGWIDRDKLLSHSGRSRKVQFELAKKYGFKGFSAPAGGCLLTDPGFSNRLSESLKHNEESIQDIELLKIGRHFRLLNKVKCIVGRNEKENEFITHKAEPKDIILEPINTTGPAVLLRNTNDSDLNNYIDIAAFICAKYCKNKENVSFKYGKLDEKGISWKDKAILASYSDNNNLMSHMTFI